MKKFYKCFKETTSVVGEIVKDELASRHPRCCKVAQWFMTAIVCTTFGILMILPGIFLFAMIFWAMKDVDEESP